MAESYRGLTIRIGGDTTELQKALRSANGAISQTNLELRNLGRALKLDPANIQNYNLQMGYLANKASNVSMALARLQDAQDEIGKKKIKIDGGETTVSEAAKAVTEYSSSIDNAAAEVSILKTKVNQLNTTLDSMHLEMRELGGDFAEIKSFEISSALDMASGKKSIADVIKEFEKLGGGVEKTKGQIESVKSSVLSMKDAFVADMNGNFNVDAIREVFESLPDVIRPSAKAIDEMVAKINNMADENNAAVLKQVA
ncbi:MAG: hypothetical protein IKE22_05315, partial [Atopobiaceae bacterium]|nr:hypothetical protein [Atopobiaceae bacterium]